jgi:hypothetical protein
MIARAMTANPSATNDHAPNSAEAVSSFISFIPKAVEGLSHTRDETGFLLTLGHGGSPCLCFGTSLYRSRFRGRKRRRQTIGESARWLPVSGIGYLARAGRAPQSFAMISRAARMNQIDPRRLPTKAMMKLRRQKLPDQKWTRNRSRISIAVARVRKCARSNRITTSRPKHAHSI